MNSNFSRLIFTIIVIHSVSLQAQNWQIAKHAGGSTPFGDGASNVRVDREGMIYVAGGFKGTAYFDSDTATSLVNSEFFLAKYDNSGNLIWLRHAGGIDNGLFNGATDLQLDSESNALVTGWFCGTAIFDTIQLISYGDQDIFIAKYDSSGNCIWAKKCGGTGLEGGSSLSLDDENNIYITGQLGSAISIFDSDTVTASNQGRIFLAKYNNNGQCLWVFVAGGTGSSYTSGIKCYEDLIYISGLFDSTITLGNQNITDGGGIIAQFDSSGVCQWIKQISRGVGRDIACDESGNIFFVGEYRDSAVFDTITMSSTNSYWDCFIAKYNSIGEIFWINSLQSSVMSLGNAITTDTNGISYITGNFQGNAHFGNSTFSTTGQQDIFISKFDENGNCLGAIQAGNTIIDTRGITIDTSGACYIAGSFQDSVVFDAITLQSYGAGDIFWAKLDGITDIQENERTAGEQLLIYANPNQGKCNITIPEEFLNETKLKLIIFDNAGRIIQDTFINMDGDRIKLNIQAHATGIYNVTLSNGKRNYSGKIIFE